jgi:hypothetical protein
VARQVARLIALLLALAGTAALGQQAERYKTPQTPWERLSSEERRILEPVAREWDRMPGYQQERLKSAARHYPSMLPIQKERFEARIRDWAAMTPQQRREARETFQGLRRLPPDKQHELRERWLEKDRSRGDFDRGRGDEPERGRAPERAPR